MRKIGLVWGAVAVLCGAAAHAAPKNATPAATGAAGAAATAPSPSASPSAPTAGAPAAPDASAPAAPVDGAAPAAPAAPNAAATPPTEPAPEADEAEEDEEERAREAARRKRKRKRQLQFDAAEDEADNESRAPLAPEAAATEPWRLVGSHFMLSVERATNLLSWSMTETASITADNNFDGFPETSNVEFKDSGTDVSFLGSGGVSRNPFAVPRVAFDGMFSNGFTLGGSLSYLVTSGKHESPGAGSSDDPTTSIFLLAPRIGVVIPASPTIGIWLRGGMTRISASTEAKLDTGDATTTTVTSTLTFVDLTLDPQLVISPVPHVGITLGVALDIGVAGTFEASNSTTTSDIKASSYGVTGGLVAIF